MKRVYFIKEDLKGKYTDGRDCPVFRALNRNGYNVVSVMVDKIGLYPHDVKKLNKGRFSDIHLARIRQKLSFSNFYLLGRPYFEIEL